MRPWLLWTAGTAALAALAAGVSSLLAPVQMLPRLQVVAPFELRDHRDRPFRSDRRDRTVLYAVGASRDSTRTPALLSLLVEVGRELARQRSLGSRVEMAFVTVDPEHDSVAVLAGLAEQWSRASGLQAGMSFLTGSPVAVKQAVGGALAVSYRPPEGPVGRPRFDFDPVAVLVDPRGYVRARYRLGSATSLAGEMVEHIRWVEREASASGVSRWMWEGAHLLLCRP